MRKRVDNNDKEIVYQCRQIGAGVVDLSNNGNGVPDKLIGFRGKNYLFEFKNPEYKWKLTTAQKQFHLTWPGQLKIVTCFDDILEDIQFV